MIPQPPGITSQTQSLTRHRSLMLLEQESLDTD